MIDFTKIPKIHLHCHMDGSCSVGFIQEYMKSMGYDYSFSELENKLVAPMDCKDLAEYLSRFELPLKCLQTKKGLKGMAEDVLLQASAENIKYIEIRFAPTSSMEEGLQLREIIESVLEGCKEAKTKCGIEYGVVVCAMRHLGTDCGIHMLKAAREYLGEGIVACDIAGDEKAFPNTVMTEYMTYARSVDFPMTIHAGECGSSASIKAAIEGGARRIGHGIAMAGHEDIIKLCGKYHVGVEMCPTSNLQTKAVTGIEHYPFKEFADAGIALSINTDNSLVSGTTLSKEFALLDKHFGLTEDMCHKIYVDSVEMSFATDDIKDRLMKQWI